MTLRVKEDPSKKPNWLDEVRQAAKLNYLRGLKEQEEKQRVSEATRNGTLDQLIEKEMSERKQAPAPNSAQLKEQERVREENERLKREAEQLENTSREAVEKLQAELAEERSKREAIEKEMSEKTAAKQNTDKTVEKKGEQ